LFSHDLFIISSGGNLRFLLHQEIARDTVKRLPAVHITRVSVKPKTLKNTKLNSPLPPTKVSSLDIADLGFYGGHE
jgi:hypothetical protein